MRRAPGGPCVVSLQIFNRGLCVLFILEAFGEGIIRRVIRIIVVIIIIIQITDHRIWIACIH